MKKMLVLISAVTLTASTSIFSVSCSNIKQDNGSQDNNSNPSNYPIIKDWKVVTDKDEFSNQKINGSIYFAVWNDYYKRTSFKINSFVNDQNLNLNEKQVLSNSNVNYNLVLARLGKGERNLYTWNSSNDLYNDFSSENSDIKYIYKYVGNDANNLNLPNIDTTSGSFI